MIEFIHRVAIKDDNYRKNNVDKIEKFLNFRDWSGTEVCDSCRSRKTLKNKPFLAIGGVDTAENEPSEAPIKRISSALLIAPLA